MTYDFHTVPWTPLAPRKPGGRGAALVDEGGVLQSIGGETPNRN